MMNNLGYIYIHTNRSNGKRYVGQTTQKPEYRWGREGYNYQDNKHFTSAISKYGWDSFDHEIIEVCEPLLDFMEKYFIQFYDTTNSEKGYNHESGGSKYKKASEETKRKMSEVRKGREISEGWRENISKSLKGHFTSEETKRKISTTLKGHSTSEEARKKMSEARKGRKLSEETKRRVSETLKGRSSPMKGKSNPHSEETRRKLSENTKLKSQEYRLYKANGGQLNWNQWRHYRKETNNG